MSAVIHCNGCNKVLDREKPAISGRRANGLAGGHPLPDGEFDWCERCARAAFGAVRDQAIRAAGWSR